MARYKTSESANDQILAEIQTTMEEKNSDINVYIGKEKMEICNQFVFLFYNSLLAMIDDYNLAKNDIKAILKILEYMQYGNLVRMSFAQLARDIGVDPTNITKITRKLKKAALLIEKDGNLFLNPHVIAKGKFKRKDENDQKLLEYSAKKLTESNPTLTPSILTAKLKKERDKDQFSLLSGISPKEIPQ